MTTVTCPMCYGSGMVAVGPWGSRPPRATCPECNGTKVVTLKVHVGLITWGPDNGDVEEFIVVSESEETVKRELMRDLIEAWRVTPDLFGDDAPEFMTEFGALSPSESSPEEIDTWLILFRAATTAPWWTVNEREVMT